MPARLDLTEERLYTLSPGTLQTLARIDEPITLRFYYSPRLGEAVPAYAVYAQRVRELLDRYSDAGAGKLRLEIHRPQPFSDEEDRAVAFGLQGVPLNAQGEQVYFGLAGTNLLDDERTIPFFQPERERFLEYDLTRLVFELSNPRRPVIGVMSSLPLNGDPRDRRGRNQRRTGRSGGDPASSPGAAGVILRGWFRARAERRAAGTTRTVPTEDGDSRQGPGELARRRGVILAACPELALNGPRRERRGRHQRMTGSRGKDPASSLGAAGVRAGT